MPRRGQRSRASGAVLRAPRAQPWKGVLRATCFFPFAFFFHCVFCFLGRRDCRREPKRAPQRAPPLLSAGGHRGRRGTAARGPRRAAPRPCAYVRRGVLPRGSQPRPSPSASYTGTILTTTAGPLALAPTVPPAARVPWCHARRHPLISRMRVVYYGGVQAGVCKPDGCSSKKGAPL